MTSSPRPRSGLPVRPRAAFLLTAAFSTCATIGSASYIPPPARSLFLSERKTCAAGSNACTNPGLPDLFCCKSGTSCIALAANTTVLCCSSESGCVTIAPIVCDISFQDPGRQDSPVVQTSVLDGVMEKCGQGCCPFGYGCDSGTCVKKVDQSSPPKRGSPLASPSPSKSLSLLPSSSQSSSPHTSALAPSQVPIATTTTTSGDRFASATASPSSSSSAVPATDANGQQATSSTSASIIGGVIGGILAAAIIGIALFCFCRRKRKDSSAGDGDGSSSRSPSRGQMISSPLVDGSTMRTDFNRKLGSDTPSSGRGSTIFPFGISPGSRRSYGANSEKRSPVTPKRPSVGQVAPIRGMHSNSVASSVNGGGSCGHSPPRAVSPPRTPTRERQVSLESINVFADPSTVGRDRVFADRRISNQTTFTSMMQEADLPDVRHGGRYVPGSAYSTPDSRR